MQPAATKLIFVVGLVVNVLLFSNSRYAPESRPRSTAALVSRALTAEVTQTECAPIRFPVGEQCAHVQTHCERSNTFIGVTYLYQYFCAAQSVRPAVFIGLLVWLAFLFSTLGISASDFLTPNLATIAQMLGLEENVAGVTFLAFGNGSPDVFSTFSAMRANSGSLAIGELLGAASFIVSVVVGSMCIIKPFDIHRGPFLRDVGFFATAVALLLVMLMDGKISPWEAGILVGLYCVYVAFVVTQTWWRRRRAKRLRDTNLARSEYLDDSSPTTLDTPYRDDPSNLTLEIPRQARNRALSDPSAPRSLTSLPTRSNSQLYSPHMPSFSLVGALEFRHVVSSLQQQSSATSLNMFESPVTPFAGGHYHTRPRSRPRTPRSSQEHDPFDAAMGVQLNERLPHSPNLTPFTDENRTITPDDRSGNGYFRDTHIHSSPDGSEAGDIETDSQLSGQTPVTKRRRVLYVVHRTYHLLCPSLHNFRDKSVLGQIASVFAAPAILLLTLTLPVVVTPYESPSASMEKTVATPGHNAALEGGERLIDFEEEGEARALIAEDIVEEEMHEMHFNKWLMAIQCILGPLFCVGVLFAGSGYHKWILAATAIAGVAVSTLVFVFAHKGNSNAFRMARCSMGFVVAVVWIMAIADEVVNVLRTFGFIFGLSDAIIGLTVFAVGNSLADLVANMSVAVFAPVMGFSACFGGPMLNILLGVGISGSYIISKTRQPYELDFSKTLLVSTVGLLFLLVVTVIFVPLNGYHLSRKWGIFLILCYLVIMTTNVVVELKT